MDFDALLMEACAGSRESAQVKAGAPVAVCTLTRPQYVHVLSTLMRTDPNPLIFYRDRAPLTDFAVVFAPMVIACNCKSMVDHAARS